MSGREIAKGLFLDFVAGLLCLAGAALLVVTIPAWGPIVLCIAIGAQNRGG